MSKHIYLAWIVYSEAGSHRKQHGVFPTFKQAKKRAEKRPLTRNYCVALCVSREQLEGAIGKPITDEELKRYRVWE